MHARRWLSITITYDSITTMYRMQNANFVIFNHCLALLISRIVCKSDLMQDGDALGYWLSVLRHMLRRKTTHRAARRRIWCERSPMCWLVFCVAELVHNSEPKMQTSQLYARRPNVSTGTETNRRSKAQLGLTIADCHVHVDCMAVGDRQRKS